MIACSSQYVLAAAVECYTYISVSLSSFKITIVVFYLSVQQLTRLQIFFLFGAFKMTLSNELNEFLDVT